MRARDPLAHRAALVEQGVDLDVVDLGQGRRQRVALAGADRMELPPGGRQGVAAFLRSCIGHQPGLHLRVPADGLHRGAADALVLDVGAGLQRLGQCLVAVLALRAQGLQGLLTLAQQVVADRHLLQAHRLDGFLDVTYHLDLAAFAPARVVVLPGGAVADHAGGQETQEHQPECRQHLAQQGHVVDPVPVAH